MSGPLCWNQSKRLDAVQAPIIPIVGDWLRETPGSISLGQGVVSYGPPPQAQRAVERFFEDPKNHKYQPVHGIPELRAALARKLSEENHISLEGREVVVTAGANLGFYDALLAVTDPGDEIVLPVPFYFNYDMAAAMANVRVVRVPTAEDHQLDAGAIERALTPRTKMVVTISPNNPTGAVYPEAALREVNALCARSGVYHLHDEAYEYFTYRGSKHFSPASIPGSEAHTVSLFSLSKSYGFASWRVGYMVLPAHLFEAVRKIQDTLLICPPAVSQHAALGALEAGPAFCRERAVELSRVRGSVLAQLREAGDLCRVSEAEGAFYFFVRPRTELPAVTLAERLVREHGVALIPGSAFGLESPCALRLSYGALAPDTVAEGVGRLVRGLRAIVGRS
jgi:aspartate/methionine/tyrosine aminotransferase